ncbi:MAG: hypothetical protein HRU35_03250 [Rickettsiaceae bacterium]|nr:hypothetical protein [Rickettsiaceae bacterium]
MLDNLKKQPKSKKRQSIILSFPDIDQKTSENNISNYCKDNNIEIIKSINFKNYHEADKYCRLIDIVSNHHNNYNNQPLMCIIKAHSHFKDSQIITLCVLASLVIAEKIEVYYYTPYQLSEEQTLFIEDSIEYFLPLAAMYLTDLISNRQKLLTNNNFKQNNGGK